MKYLPLVFLFILVCAESSPIDDYVNAKDPEYKYSIIGKYKGAGYTNYVINMTSQRWKTESVSDRSIWWHYLTITVPDKITYKDAAILYIDGGSNTDSPPTAADEFVTLTTLVGVSVEAVSANLKMVPNQPIVYKDDPSQKRRDEDANVAWTWRKYLLDNSSTPDPNIVLEFPMTKSAVRAMDTVTAVVQNVLGNVVNRYVVTGASKRGWTTWLTAAVDKRVIGMAPLVMDLLNIQKNLHHHYRSLGGWTFAFSDYHDVNITTYLDSPRLVDMANLIDPIAYKNRYTNMPKIVVSTAGDEFFLLDDSHFYFNDLPGTTHLRILPDAEHSLAGHVVSIMFTLRAFFLSTATNTPLPKLNWTRTMTEKGGKITVHTDRTPTSVLAFYSRTIDNERRDFRLFVAAQPNSNEKLFHPVFWFNRNVTALGNNTYEAEFDNPPQGWLAFFIQVTFEDVGSTVLEFTTETQIIPDTYPFPDCHGAGCFGILV